MTLTRESVLFGHDSPETAYLVTDYPYGFRLRTSIRYWVETTRSGDRFCSQTLNPKTGQWNKPKKSTYTQVMAMYLDDLGHVTHAGVGHYASDEWLAKFMEVTEGQLSTVQLQHLAEVIGTRRAMAGVTYTVTEGRRTPEEEAEQAKCQRIIAGRIGRAVSQAREELGA